ncbi:MAG TPA: hypothetical protein VMH49_06460 [Thermoplasmata archaeon]|nr:hypothetical protein [Thermoplasmata archaeon]
MRRFRAHARGLAEIVGTLMLVVIVVAAATAFSFFVAAYQRQVEAQETLNHDRTLEKVKVVGVSESTCASLWKANGCNESGAPNGSFANLSFVVSSLDVNRIVVSALFIDKLGVVNYTARWANGTTVSPCYNASAHVTGKTFTGLVACAPLSIPAFASVTLKFDLDAGVKTPSDAPVYALGLEDDAVSATGPLTFQLLTSLANLFTQTFVPPVAVASIFFVSDGTGSVPVFSGLASFQPPGADNASLVWYYWTTSPTTNCSGVSSPELECDGLAPGHVYAVTLQVTNTDGLSGTASLTYSAPT